MHLNKHENEHEDAVAAVGNVAKKGLRGRESPHTKSAGPEIPPGVPGWSTREPNPNFWPKPTVTVYLSTDRLARHIMLSCVTFPTCERLGP